MSAPVPTSPFTRSWGAASGAPRILLVHGLSSYSGSWWRVASELAEAGCTVTAPDLRGHGLSPPSTHYGFSAMASDLAELNGSWDLVVGHSLAGPIVVGFASSMQRCRSVLLLDPLMDIDDDEFEGVVADQLSEVDEATSSERVRRLHPRWHPEDCFHKAMGARATSHFVVERCLRDNAPYHHLDLFEELTVPTSILGSDPSIDTLFPPESMDRIHNSDVSYRMAEGCGHSIHRIQPDLAVRVALDQLG